MLFERNLQMRTIYLVAVMGGSQNMAFHANYTNRIGVTDEPIDSKGFIWCTFDWGFAVYKRSEILFLRPISINPLQISDISIITPKEKIVKLRDKNLPRVFVDKSIITSWSLARDS